MSEMTTNNRNELGKMLKQQQHMAGLTLLQVAARSGVSASHIGRIERGQRFPSARILQRLAKPLGLEETELLYQAGLLSAQPTVEAGSEAWLGRLDPYVARALSQEPVEIQRTVIAILSIFKSMSRSLS